MPPVRDLGIAVPESARSGGFGQNHSPEVERGRKTLHSEPSPRNQLEPALASSPCSSLYFTLCPATIRSPPARPPVPGTTSCSSAAPPARGKARRARAPGTGYKGWAAAADCGPRCARKSAGRAAPGTGPDPDPGIQQRSPPHCRPQPVPLQSPPPSLDPLLRRHRRLSKEWDLDPHPSRDPQTEFARPPRLDQRQEPSADPHSRPSRGMPSPCPATRMYRGPASYFKDPLVPGPLAWGLERLRTSGRRQLPTSAGGQGCRAPSAPPLFGSWRKVNRVLGTPEREGLGQLQGREGPVWSRRTAPS